MHLDDPKGATVPKDGDRTISSSATSPSGQHMVPHSAHRVPYPDTGRTQLRRNRNVRHPN